MNPLLSLLQPYPFERLRQLFSGVTPNANYRAISLGIGEPKHATPPFILDALDAAGRATPSGLAAYPATAGDPALRQAFASWLQRRYSLHVNGLTQTLPVNGSREALFALAQTVINPAAHRGPDGKPHKPWVICPNPFYQIYEGAALLSGAQPWFVPALPSKNFAPDWDSVPAQVWAHTQLVFVCSPGNPTGAVMPMEEWQKLFALSAQYNFVIASDECYSEIYFRDEAPLGGLQAAVQCGVKDFKNLISLTSLSKRSNVPGLRSGFVAGDAALIAQFLLYRTYHGSAMSPVVQSASIGAWGDEEHVVANRHLYRTKFAQVAPVLASVLDVVLPDAAFYLWAKIPDCVAARLPGAQAEGLSSDAAFARALYANYNVTVLPGSYLARDFNGLNPGAGRIRMALVAETEECLEAAQRIVQFCKALA